MMRRRPWHIRESTTEVRLKQVLGEFLPRLCSGGWVVQVNMEVAVKIDREELYRRVWETPVTRLAKEFDISDVGLAKACRKHAVPLPPVGYWTKIKHGKVIPKPALPQKAPVLIELDAARFRASEPAQKLRVDLPSVAVVVPTAKLPEQFGPYTAATRKRLLKDKPDAYGFVGSAGPAFFECRLSAGAVESACQILYAIEGALPSVGAKLVKGEQCLQVEHDGERVHFKLVEQYTRQQHVVSDKYYKGWDGKEYVYTFTGKFSLEIEGDFSGRKRWTDGKTASLTEKLGDFVHGLVEAAAATRRHAIAREAEHRRWEEEARRREEIQRDLRAVEDFKLKLLAEAAAFRESQLISAYLERVHEQLADDRNALAQPAKDWLDLAQRIASKVDPTTRRVERLKSGIASSSHGGGYFGDALK